MVDAGEFARDLCRQIKRYKSEVDASKACREAEQKKNEAEKHDSLEKAKQEAEKEENDLRAICANDKSSIQSIYKQDMENAKKHWQGQMQLAAQKEAEWQQKEEEIRKDVLKQLPYQADAKTVEEAFRKLKDCADTLSNQKPGFLDPWLRPQVNVQKLKQQIKDLENEYQKEKNKAERDSAVIQNNAKTVYENDKRKAEQVMRNASKAKDDKLRVDLNAVETERANKERNAEKKFLQDEKDSQEKLEKQLRTLDARMLNGIQRTDPRELEKAYRYLKGKIASYRGFQPADTLGDGLLFGRMVVDITSQGHNSGFRSYVEQNLQFALTASGKRRGLAMPYFRSFADPAFSTIINFNNAGRSKAVASMNAWAMQLLMNNPVGKVQFVFISPNDVGRSFASFMRLSKGDERLISTRIWCDASDIEAQMEQLRLHAIEVTQKDLQGRYCNILEYNQHAGKNAEPLRFIFAMDYPNGFTQAALDKLLALQGNGPENGIYTILAGRTDDLLDQAGVRDPRYNDTVQKVAAKLTGITINGREDGQGDPKCALRISNSMRTPFIPLKLPKDAALIDEVFETLTEAARKAQRVTINYKDVMGELVNNEDRWFQYSDDECIEVPIALTGADEKVNLRLTCRPNPNQADTCHAVITGMIGSGKSVLLKTLIMGLLLKYSPEDVQIFALDFKEGVEFRTFAKYHLRNFRALSIETEPKFGLAVLNYLDNELERRAGELGGVGVDNLEDYRRVMARRGIAHHKMPRYILIIDEYQELLRDPSDPVQKKAAELITKFVEKGRACSINVIMATQDPRSARALAQNTYGQFGVRVLLRNNKESAQILLENNDDAAQLTNFDSGVAIYNTFAGDKEHDIRCNIAFETTETINALLKRIEAKQSREKMPDNSDRPNDRQRVLLGSVMDDLDCPLNRFAATGVIPQSNSFSYQLYLGQQMEMFDNFHPEFDCEEKCNLLIANRESSGLTVLSFILRSILLNACRLSEIEPGEKLVTVFDFNRSEWNGSDGFYQLLDAMQQEVAVFSGPDIWHGLDRLHQLEAQKKRQFVFVIGPEKTNRLQMRSNRFQASPADEIEKMLWNGPENGMNFVFWTGNARSFLANYGNMLDEFEDRLVGEVGSKDELEKLLGKKDEEMIQKSSSAYYWNPDGVMQVRLYAEPTQEWAQKFDAKLKEELEKQRKV